MNATNITTTTIEVFGMNFISAESALREFGFTSAAGEVLPVIWHNDISYWEQPATVREIHGETVLVRDLSLQGYTILDDEKLMNFYLVEGRTLRGTPRLYALNFWPQENGTTVETWTELTEGTVWAQHATDDEEDERRAILVRLEDGGLLVKVTGRGEVHAWRSFAVRVMDEAARKI